MIGVCQTCGSVAPLEWFLSAGKYKLCLDVMGKLPRDVAPAAVRYLTLFRPASGRSMSPDKTLRLLSELADLVAKGHVQEGRKPARRCPPKIWADAIDKMRESPTLNLPMESHTYLIKVAYGLADAEDARAEAERRQAEQNGNFRSLAGRSDRSDEECQTDWADLTDEEWELLPAHIRAAHEHERVKG